MIPPAPGNINKSVPTFSLGSQFFMNYQQRILSLDLAYIFDMYEKP